MKRVTLRYMVHVCDLTHRAWETIEAPVATAGDVIDYLEGKYPGFRDLFVEKETGDANPRNPLVLNRAGEAARIIPMDTEIRSGDILGFY